jgi:hypothetical protein
MSTKSREVIFGSRIRSAKIHADNVRERAKLAIREADRAEPAIFAVFAMTCTDKPRLF